MPTLWTIGYEKLLPPELVNELRLAGVERLIDVRYRAQSRRPGMSKTRLSELLADSGIAYEHRRALGTPPDIRWFFKNKREAEGREQFRAHVEETAAAELDALAGELEERGNWLTNAVARVEAREREIDDRAHAIELTVGRFDRREQELELREAALEDRDQQLSEGENALTERRRRIREDELKIQTHETA